MPVTITRRLLSGSTNGQPIAITSTQGVVPVTIHAPVTGATTSLEEIFIYAQNNASSNVNLVVEFGISTSGHAVRTPLPPLGGLQLVIPGLLIGITASTITGWLDTTASLANSGAGQVAVYGYINRIAQT